MNKKISITLLILLIAYSVAFYVIKYAYPEILLNFVVSDNVIKFGNFLESWKGFEIIYKILSSFLTLYLFACACCGRFKFKWYEFLYIAIATILNRLVIQFLPELYTHTSISIMLILSALLKGDILNTAISFAVHGYLSQFLLKIRGFETILVKYNLASGIMLSFEMFVGLLVLALVFKLRRK